MFCTCCFLIRCENRMLEEYEDPHVTQTEIVEFENGVKLKVKNMSVSNPSKIISKSCDIYFIFNMVYFLLFTASFYIPLCSHQHHISSLSDKPTAHNPEPVSSRRETSLVRLTRKFTEELSRCVDGVLDITKVSQELCVRRRRIYDITNVLEGIKLIKKTSKSHIQWL